MIVLENRRRKPRRGKAKTARRGRKGKARRSYSLLARSLYLRPGKGRKVRVAIQRNPFMGSASSSDEGGASVFASNKGRKKTKKRGLRRDAKGRFLKKGRKAARRPAARKSPARKSPARRLSARKFSLVRGKKLIRVTHAKRGLTVAMKNRRRQYRRNAGWSDLSAAQQKRIMSHHMARLRTAYRPSAVSAEPGFVGPLEQYEAKQKKRGRAKEKFIGPPLPKRWYPPFARSAAEQGVTPRQLAYALQDVTHEELIKMFPSFEAYLAWVKKMMKDPAFRAWAKKAMKMSKTHKPSRKTRKVSKKKGGRKAARRKTSRRRNAKGQFVARRNAARRRRHGRRRLSASVAPRRRRSRVSRSHARRRYGRRVRRNGSRFVPNFAFMSMKEMLIAGGIALGSYMLINAVSGYAAKSKPLYGVLAGAALGGLAIWKGDKLFHTDSYAKATAFAGLLALAGSAVSAYKASKTGSLMGMGAIPSRSMVRYQHNPFAGPFVQAQAGFGAPFQQALAAPFYQAQAGFGEYYTGTGEYVSQDGALTPVSDLGEYVAQRLSVEGFADYEVLPQYTPGADGFGLVNDGVHPASNMDREFDIIEAAAGLGAAPSATPRQDYVPTVQSGFVGNQESAPEAGIFDVGGNNGVFG